MLIMKKEGGEKSAYTQSNNETKFKLNIPKMMEFQMTFITSMDSNDIWDSVKLIC